MSAIPTQIGPYRLGRELGRGGMGVVHLGRDTRLERDVAIKALPADIAQDAERLMRFEREAKALAQLSHPNVAGIHGVEEHDGTRYLILEFVDGETLADRLDRGPLPVDEAIEVATQIAAGLEAAHEAGIVHRDLKPGNVMLTTDDRVKILDFGLATAPGTSSSSGRIESTGSLETSPARAADANPAPATQLGAVLGTVSYMSPEQARGRRVDKRSDIWSFGVLLFESMTGACPFVGETAGDSIGAVLHKSVDLDILPPETPARVRRLLQRCLTRDRDARLRDIGDARLELTADEVEPTSAPRSPAARPGFRSAGWMLAAVAIVAAAWLALRPVPAPVPEVLRASILAPEDLVFRAFELAPDGGQIAAIVAPAEIGVVPGPRVTSIVVRDLDAAQARPVPGSEGAFVHRYAPDGESIVFVTRGRDSSDSERLMRVPRDLSTAPVEIMRVPNAYRWGLDSWFCWTTAGELAFLDRSAGELFLHDPGTGREIRRIQLQTDGVPIEFGGLDRAFDDRHLVATIQRFEPSGYVLDTALLDLESGRVHTVVEGGINLRHAGPDHVLFARGDSIYLSAIDAATQNLTGERSRVLQGLATGTHWGHGAFAIARDGTLVYRPGGVQGSSRSLVLTTPDGVGRSWSDDRRAFEESVAISSDGTRLAVIVSGRGGLYELWVSEVDPPRLRPLLVEPGTDFYEPVFTPSGDRVVVSRWRPENATVPGGMVLAPFDGQSEVVEFSGGWTIDEWVVPRSVSADGERLLFQLNSDGFATLFERRLDNREEPRELHRAPAIYTASYAPTSAPLLAYVSNELGRAEVFVRTLEDGQLGPAIPVTTLGAWACSWMVDPEDGLCIVYHDLEFLEHRTPIGFEENRITVGSSVATGRTRDLRMLAGSVTRNGDALTIQRGDDERPAAHLSLARGWMSTILPDR